jgi:hypothetical protein
MIQKLEYLANTAILLVAGLIGFQAYRGDAPKVSTPDPKPGVRLTLPGVDWRAHPRTVLFLLSPQCHFCSESAPFYRRLTGDPALTKRFRFIAVLPSQVDESKSYLSTLKVTVNDILQFNFASWGVPGTPTIILVNSEGKVQGTWVGKLSAGEEDRILIELNRS